MIKARCAELRQMMIDHINAVDPDKTACLSLSGGTDSTTALFAMLASGRKPRCYTFMVAGKISDDLKSSTRLARDFGLEHIVSIVPDDRVRTEASTREVIGYIAGYTKVKKTIVECLHPWLYVGPEMMKRGETSVFTGFAADDFYVTAMKNQKRVREMGEAEFTARGYRDHYYDHADGLLFVDKNVRKFLADRYGVTMHDAYADGEKKIQEWFKQFTLRDLQLSEDGAVLSKAASVYAFADYFEKGSYLRKPSPYQVNSGLRELHEVLLDDPRLNPTGAKAVIKIYNDMAAGTI